MRLFTPGLVLLVMLGFSCRSDYPQIRAYYQERGISHCLAGNCMQGNGQSDIGNGMVYEGRFENYVPDGEGVLFKEGKLVYSGQWKSGFPADEGAPLLVKEDGTQDPVSGGFGPKVKDYDDQKGINTAVGIFTTIACAAGGRCRGPNPQR